jgi:hypothetical protein
LILATLPHANDVANDDHGEGVDPAASNTGDTSTGVKPHSALCEPTEQVAEDEQEEGSEEDGLATEDIAQSRGNDLEGGVGEEEGRADPGYRGGSVEFDADDGCSGRDGCRVEEGEEKGEL